MKLSVKNILIFISSVLLITTMILFLTIPIIEVKLNGDDKITINIGEIYEEKGAKSFLKFIKNIKELPVEISGNVDSNKIGTYEISYKSDFMFKTKQIKRIVRVFDMESPVIVLENDPKICQKNNLIQIQAKAIDNVDGEISNKIKYKIDNEKIYISVEDSSNNVSEIVYDVKYADEELPEINLNGDKVVDVIIGSEYIDEGAKALDSCDGDISNNISIEGKVDTSKLGNYKILYKVSDSFGNIVTTERQINVIKKSEKNKIVNERNVYLTFDDGPGIYTEEILSILKANNVKATFFVTNQFPKYQYLIKKAYEDGHTIGLHTYSHKWSIYSSIETYLDDFNKILEIVKKETGSDPKYFRFPGGSSNTVSAKYKKGIMTELSSLLEKEGYIYFDWTFDSGDTNKKNNSKKAILNNVKLYLKGDGNYIILMHDIKKNTLLALPEIIDYCKKNGYKLKKIDENTPIEHFKIAN